MKDDGWVELMRGPYRSVCRQIRGRISGRLRHAEEAEDIVMDALASLIADGGGPPDASLLWVVAVRRMHDASRRLCANKRGGRLSFRELGEDDAIDYAEPIRRLLAAEAMEAMLAGRSERDRGIITGLSEGRGQREVAERARTSTRAVDRVRARAVAAGRCDT